MPAEADIHVTRPNMDARFRGHDYIGVRRPPGASFAIRAALGAGAKEIVRSVLARGLAPAAAGMVVGVAGAAVVSRLFSSLLFGVATLDSISYGWGLAAAAGASLLASLPPAYRAARVPIVRLLRAE
jgi:ABC-type antimicrobial peptide transport system permease subunit